MSSLYRLGLILALAIAYFGAAKFGFEFADPDHPAATLLWAPTGIAIAALFRLGPWMLVGVWLGAFCANLTNADTPLGVSAVIALGNTLEGGAGALLLYTFGFLKRAWWQQLGLLVGVVAQVALISASIGTSALVVGDVLPSSEWGPALRDWYLGDVLGGIIVGGALLRLRRQIPRWELSCAVLAVACAVGSLVLSGVGAILALAGAALILVYATLRNDRDQFG